MPSTEVTPGPIPAETGSATQLRPWSPWSDLTPWGSRFGELLDQMWAETPLRGALAPLGSLRETDDAFVVELDLPGVRREDLEVDVVDRRLSVTGDRKVTQAQDGVLRRSTRYATGRFSYASTLPEAVDPAAATATMADGVLTVTLPKAPGVHRTHVPVT